MFLKLSSQIEGQLREAYAKKHAIGALNQSTLADRLGVDRSVINRRLTGKVNMTEESIADMVWAMEYDINVNIFDPTENQTNHKPASDMANPAPHDVANAPRQPEREKASALDETKKNNNQTKKEKSPGAADLAYAQ